MQPSLFHGSHKNSDICHNMAWLPLPLVLSWHCNLLSPNISCDSSFHYQWNSKFWLHLMPALTTERSLQWIWTHSFGCPPTRVIIPGFTKVDFLTCLYIIISHWPIVWYGQQFGDSHTQWPRYFLPLRLPSLNVSFTIRRNPFWSDTHPVDVQIRQGSTSKLMISAGRFSYQGSCQVVCGE